MLAPNTTRASISAVRLRAAKRRASQLGYQLVPMSDAQRHDPGVPLNPPAAVA